MQRNWQNQNSGGENSPDGSKRRIPPQRSPQKKNQKPPREDEFNWNRVGRVIASWLGILLAVFVIMYAFRSTEETEHEISFNAFQGLLADGKISEATIKKSSFNDYDLHGKLTSATDVVTVSGKQVRNATRIVLTLPYSNIDNRLIDEWNAKGLKFTISKEDNTWFNALISFLPWILLIAVWVFLFRRMQAGSGGTKGLFSFGKSRAKLLTEGGIKVTFKDVAGADEAKVELQEIIEFLKDAAKFQRLGGKIPRGVLLLGPPGTGKTLLARAIAGEAGVPFFSISGADFVEMFVGVGASRVRDLFDQGKKNAPCIIFIDEIDAVGRHRGAGLGGGHDEREQTLNQLLVEMDGFEQNSGVIIIAATNRPDVLDPALLRPGRFDRQVVVDRPDVKGREGIFQVHTKHIPLDTDVKLEVLAKGTPGLAGADIANLVNEAALLAARQNCSVVSMRHFEEAKDKVMMGMERKSLIISDREKKVTAYHEAGHVLVAKFLPEADPVHKVTIIPRGRALGVTTYLPIDEKHTYSRDYLETMITYALGGRAAESLVFNQITTGAGNDIERATEIARKMVCEWGMSDKLGPLAYGAKEEEIFLGREITRSRNFSEQTAIAIDAEVKRIVTRCMKRAEKILKENMSTLHKLSNALLEREILDAEEIGKIMKGERLPPGVRDSNSHGSTAEKVQTDPGNTAEVTREEASPATPTTRQKKSS
ncbi:MAG: ATP-dependent metallopeptidase FtsH/Yme1/Tma family protein [Ignavibacteria bacterium]|nr:ATP-dependent metallopeptidase FtsH/Yme1/Tma family protein [Ignavibacteria bacterium]